MNNLKFYDFEVFPHWWCCVVSDEEETYPGGLYDNKFTKEDELRIKSKMRIYSSDNVKTLEHIQHFKEDMSKGIMCGYNIKRYDMIILKCVFTGFTPEKIYRASQLLVDSSLASTAEDYRLLEFIKYGWKNDNGWQDLLDDSEKSLKDKECSLGMDIRETTVPFGKEDLTEQDKKDLLFYCKHDVYALHVYYVTTAKGYIDTKIQLCDSFELSHKEGYTNTNATLSGKALGAERVHGTTITNPAIIIRNEALNDYLKKWVPKDIYEHLLNKQESKTFELYENIVDIGDGGLHSVYKLDKIDKREPGLYIESDDEWTMYNVDVSSCYPSTMIYCDSMSRAIKKPERLKYIFNRRLELKQIPKKEWSEQDKIFVAAAKLVLNTTFGAMGNKYLALYDDYMRSKTCRVGQLILIALGNCLFNSVKDLKVIQNNTDGILVYTKRSNLENIQKLIDELSAITNFKFEVEEDNKLWQLNVNNYIALSPEGNIKNKGGAFIISVFQKGYNKLRPLGNYCIPKIQMDFYINKGVNPLKKLLEHNIVEDFCVTCTKGPTYDYMVQYNKDETVKLGKVARVIAVTNEELGIIKKVGVVKRESTNKHIGDLKEDTVALCPPHALIVNDDLNNYYIENEHLYHKETGESWEIDYAYYARELDKALNIPWIQLKHGIESLTEEFNL